MADKHSADPSPSFKFHVEIDGVKIAFFTECSGLEFETKTFDYQEGGVNSHIHRFPTSFVFTNLVLKRGIATDGKPLWDWMKNMVRGKIVTHNVTVTLFDLTGKKPLRTWTFLDAYPVKWASTPLSADQNAIAIETLTLAHQGLLFDADGS